MKTTASATANLTSWLASLCFLLLASFTTVPANAQDESVDFDYFYDNLAEHGDWIEVEGYGYCFRPFAASDNPDWQPYSEGSWAETEGGWTWVSTEPFGWATYHYGRWTMVDNFWVWVPGYEWAPAWVSWRENEEYVGWAPLPPEAQWSNDRGFDANVDIVFDIGPRYYNFIPIRFFGEPNCRPHLVSRDHNHTYIRNTVNITYIHYRESPLRLSRIFVGGPRYDYLERHSEHDIRRLKLSQHRYRDQDGPDGRRNRVENDRFSVFAPSISHREGRERAIAPREVKMRTNRDKVDRGWRGIAQDQVSEIRHRISEQERERPDRERRQNEERNRDGNRDRDGERDNFRPRDPNRVIPLPPGMSDPRERDRDRDGRGPSSQDMREKDRDGRGPDRDGDRGPNGAPGSNPQSAIPMPGQDGQRGERGERGPNRDGERGPGGAPGSNPQRGPGQERNGERGERNMPPSTEQRERERTGKPDESLPPGRVRPATPPETGRGPTPETQRQRPDGPRDMPSTPGNQPSREGERERGPQARPDQPSKMKPPGQEQPDKPREAKPDVQESKRPDQPREMKPAVQEPQRREQPQQRRNEEPQSERPKNREREATKPTPPPQVNRVQEAPPQARQRTERPDSPPRQEQPKRAEQPKPQAQPEKSREQPKPEQRRAEAPRPQPQQERKPESGERRGGGGKDKNKDDREDRKKKD